MDDRGFSLVETLLALSLVALALAAVAQLCAMSTYANADARRTTMATVLASQKMEQLRGGAAALEPASFEPASFEPALSDSLDRNIPGLCDFLDAYGRSLRVADAGGTVPPVGTLFVRRWSIEALPAISTDTLLLQVVVRPAGRGAGRGWGNRRVEDERLNDERLFGGAHLVTIKMREVG